MGFGRLPTLPGTTYIGEDRSCDWVGRIGHLSVNFNSKIVAPMAIARIHYQPPLSAKWFNNQWLNLTRVPKTRSPKRREPDYSQRLEGARQSLNEQTEKVSQLAAEKRQQLEAVAAMRKNPWWN